MHVKAHPLVRSSGLAQHGTGDHSRDIMTILQSGEDESAFDSVHKCKGSQRRQHQRLDRSLESALHSAATCAVTPHASCTNAALQDLGMSFCGEPCHGNSPSQQHCRIVTPCPQWWCPILHHRLIRRPPVASWLWAPRTCGGQSCLLGAPPTYGAPCLGHDRSGRSFPWHESGSSCLGRLTSAKVNALLP